jgi:hypothetical protein
MLRNAIGRGREVQTFSAAHIERRSSSVRRSMRSRRTQARARIAENRAATGAIFEAREIISCGK